MKMKQKEEYTIILDYLPYGYPLEKKMMPIAQAIGVKTKVLLELIPRKDVKLEINERVYIGPNKREKIYYILGKLKKDKITETTKENLQEFIDKEFENDEKKFIDFFNYSNAINTRLHQFELIPGFGKKHTEAILKERTIKPFESLEDLKKRVTNLPDPKRAIKKRIIKEIIGEERYNLFTE